MAFSKQWNKLYSDNTHMSVWPWSDVVSLVHQYCKLLISNPQNTRVLEIGCGAGANIPLFQRLGFNYFGIEGSLSIVKQLHLWFPDLKKQIVCKDFTKVQPFDMDFDLILDRASITHNDMKSIKATLGFINKSLKKNGLFMGIDWFSENHSDSKKGRLTDDDFTRTDIIEGGFKGVGKVHFSSLSHLRKLLEDFEIIYLEEKIIKHHDPSAKNQFGSFNFVVKKKNA